MKNKDLITDILTHLKENDEARERFEKQMPDYFSIIIGETNWKKDFRFFINVSDRKILVSPYKYSDFLIHALSSPQGKPICGFLEIKELRVVGTGEKICKINYAEKLFYLYIDEIHDGETHDKAYKKINQDYINLKI